MRLRHVFLSMILALGVAGGTAMAAADYDEGLAAFNRRDYRQAFDVWTPLAAQGNTRAQAGIAYLLDHGLGETKDVEEAARWYRTAAEYGFSLAQFFLGSKYTTGSGVPKDDIRAYKWLKLAADQGDPAASNDLVNLRSRMTATDVREAELLAKQFRPTGSAAVTAQPSEYRPHYETVAATAVANDNKNRMGRDDIRRIQTLLEEVGYDPGPADGMAGRRTAVAIREFERDAGLKVTGEPSKTLLVALEERAKAVQAAANRQPTLEDRTGMVISGGSNDSSAKPQAVGPQFVDRSTASLGELQQGMQTKVQGVQGSGASITNSPAAISTMASDNSVKIKGTLYPLKDGLAWLVPDDTSDTDGIRGIAVFSDESWSCSGCKVEIEGQVFCRTLTYKAAPVGMLSGIELTAQR